MCIFSYLTYCNNSRRIREKAVKITAFDVFDMHAVLQPVDNFIPSLQFTLICIVMKVVAFRQL